MSDDHAAPDPMDKAYAQAEALLADEAARAARRARVLEAVSRETPPAAAPSPAGRRFGWRHGGWLAAACVAGLSVLVATRIYLPPPVPPPAAPAAAPQAAPATAPVVQDLGNAPSPPPTARPPRRAASRPAPAAAPPPGERTPPSADIAAAPPPAAPPPPAVSLSEAPAPPPAYRPVAPQPSGLAAPPPTPLQPRAAPPAAGNSIEEMIVTGEKRTQATAKAARVASPAPPPADPAARLRSAAALGRTAEVEALLASGAAVDAPDAEGDTALMKAIRADKPAVAALLRRYGASLDHKNRAGMSAKEIAAAVGDSELTRALGLEP
jgi:hypothetical protein